MKDLFVMLFLKKLIICWEAMSDCFDESSSKKTNGCSNSSLVRGRRAGSIYRQSSRNFWQCGLRELGIFGGSFVVRNLCKIWALSEPTSIQGGSPVAISIMQHPKLHMSDWGPCPVCLTTSGAIQKGDPFRDLLFILVPFSNMLSFSPSIFI